MKTENFDIYDTQRNCRIYIPDTEFPDPEWLGWWICGCDQTIGVGRWDDLNHILFVLWNDIEDWEQLCDKMREYDETHPYLNPE